MSLWLLFAAVLHKSGRAANRPGTCRSITAAAGDGFQKQNQDGRKSTDSSFHLKVRIKVVAPASTVLGQRVGEVPDLLGVQCCPLPAACGSVSCPALAARKMQVKARRAVIPWEQRAAAVT